jgi:hypothetical protein
MIEHYRSGLLWKLFMANVEMRSAVHRPLIRCLKGIKVAVNGLLSMIGGL